MGLWEDLLKLTKETIKKGSEKALESGKGALKDITEHPFKTVAKETAPGKLTQAFKDMLSKDSLKSGKLAEGIGSLSNLSQPQSGRQAGDTPSSQYNQNDLGFDVASAFTFGLATGKEMGNRLSSKTPDRIPLERPSIVSENQQFQRPQMPQVPMQYVPGPEGSVIGGQGEVMPNYSMESPQSSIPPQYMDMARLVAQRPLQNMANMQQPPPMIPSQYQGMVNRPSIQGQPMQQPSQQQLAPGAFAGLKEGILGMPSSAYEQDYAGKEGRETAYYMGKLIPDIIRSKLGVNTTGEEARQQLGIKSSEQQMDLREKIAKDKGKPSEKSLLQMAQTEAFKRMGGGLLGQAAMTTKEGKATYLKMVEDLYKEYAIRFGIGSGYSENMSSPEESTALDTNW